MARELARDRPPRRTRGLVVFFTGLSGSGKSTIARGVADALLETGERTVTLLDGDVVRRELSAGLTFSKADRDLQHPPDRLGRRRGGPARRAGAVLPDRALRGGPGHGPATGRARRARASCWYTWPRRWRSARQRDRKGLYAKARAGELTGMTGIDDPYEEPTDADLTVDTSELTIDAAVNMVLAHLARAGWIDPRRARD